MLNGLSLFTGIGGLDVALSNYVRPIAYCEIDPYCQGVLLSRMATGDIRTSPIWDDITTLDGSEFESEIDVVYGGFPCQGISVAGLGKGLEDERSGLFFEIIRLAKEIKPKFIFLENVPAITKRGGVQVIGCLAKMGYDCRWCVISAASMGSPQNRQRWFCLAHSKHFGLSSPSTLESSKETIRECQERKNKTSQSSGNNSQRMLSANSGIQSQNPWTTESPICRMVDGVPYRMERIKSLANSVCTQQAKEAFKILMGMK